MTVNRHILITGATAGIGLETAKSLAKQGHHLLVHGRSAQKVEALERSLSALGSGAIEGYVADLSRMADIESLASVVAKKHRSLDALINNAGVFKVADPITPAGFDVRFVVNTFAPFVLTQRLLPVLGTAGRVINLSSAAQSVVNLDALAGRVRLSDFEAYAQSKLALTMFTCHLGRVRAEGPVLVAVNPGSMLGTEMVRQGFGVAGKDVGIGAAILVRAALSEDFAAARGAYFDNDAGQFSSPHPDAADASKCLQVLSAVESLVRAAAEDTVR